jgi:hypothetical protein
MGGYLWPVSEPRYDRGSHQPRISTHVDAIAVVALLTEALAAYMLDQLDCERKETEIDRHRLVRTGEGPGVGT